MGLFDSIFKELDSIITTMNNSASQFEFTSSGKVPKNVVTPADANSDLENFNRSLDKMLEVEQNMTKNFKKK